MRISLLESFGMHILEVQDLLLLIKTAAYKFLHCNKTSCHNRNTCRQNCVSCNSVHENALGLCLLWSQFWTQAQQRERALSSYPDSMQRGN